MKKPRAVELDPQLGTPAARIRGILIVSDPALIPLAGPIWLALNEQRIGTPENYQFSAFSS
jgi:hypothetical protein